MSTLRVNNLQNTSTTDGGISINNSGHVTVDGVAMPSAGPLTNRNLIINGAMQVAQRGATETGVNNTRYSGPDRWRVVVAAGTYTVSRSTTAPEGFSDSWKLDCTTSGTLGASDLMLFHQRIEGQNVQHLKYGTANAEQLTASFWIRSTKTGTVTVEFYQPNDLRQISKTVTIDTANTWEYKTVTIPGDTTGVIDDTNDRGLELIFWLGAGSNFTSGTLNTTGWAGVTNANRVSSSNIDISDSTSNDIYITGVQLEVGSVATPFEHRSYGDELARCERYFQIIRNLDGESYGSSTALTGSINFRTAMRTKPSMDVTGALRFTRPFYSNLSQSSGDISFYDSTTASEYGAYCAFGNFSAFNFTGPLQLNDSTNYITAAAEL
jgi:hypothetical protein